MVQSFRNSITRQASLQCLHQNTSFLHAITTSFPLQRVPSVPSPSADWWHVFPRCRHTRVCFHPRHCRGRRCLCCHSCLQPRGAGEVWLRPQGPRSQPRRWRLVTGREGRGEGPCRRPSPGEGSPPFSTALSPLVAPPSSWLLSLCRFPMVRLL